MPEQGRYALKSADPADYERSISLQDNPLVYLAPGEAEFVAATTDANGLDIVEQEARKRAGRKTDYERAVQLQRLLPHRSTVTPAMAQIHQRRYVLWQQGFAVKEIATLEDVEDNAVSRSITYSLSLLPGDEILRAKNNHMALNAHLEHSIKYQNALVKLLDSTKEWAIDKGMTHFERIVGIAGGQNISVNVDNRKQSAHFANGASAADSGPMSFEEAFQLVRSELAADETAQAEPNAPIDAEIITSNEPV